MVESCAPEAGAAGLVVSCILAQPQALQRCIAHEILVLRSA